MNRDATYCAWCRIVIFAAVILLGTTAFAASGGGTTGPNPLPTSPPAPDILMRDSFGQGPELMRPASGKGTLKPTATGGTSFNGFWLEYPGNKNNRWVTSDSGETWRFCGTGPNPYELFSPLQVTFGFEQSAVLCTLLNAPLSAPTRPTALLPLPSSLTVPYEFGVEAGYWNAATNPYVAMGLTNSAITTDNLKNSGQIVLILKPADPGGALVAFELRRGGFNGELLASGVSEDDDNFNRMRIRYDPSTRSVGASFKGLDVGTFVTDIAPPRYAAFEGVGFVDNFVIRKTD